jgi:hypothetical protein
MLKPKEWQRERERERERRKKNERRIHLSYKIYRGF